MVSARIRTLLPPVLAAFAVVSVIDAWIAGILHHIFDFDEIQHAHAIWLIAHGKRPFIDFFEVHPPFAWWALTPMVQLFPRPIEYLIALRFFAAAGSLAAMAMLAFNLRAAHRDLPWPWIAGGLLLPAVFMWNVAYFAEFRIDSWPLALILCGSAVAVGERKSISRSAFAGFAVVSGMLLSPKFVFLAVALLAAVVVMSVRRGAGEVVKTALAYAAGAAASVGLASALLLAHGIAPSMAFDLVIRFHAAFARVARFPASLSSALRDEPLLLALIAGGFACWLISVIRRRIVPAPLEVATAVFLALEIALVPLPYKQYTVPWFLLGSLFIASIYYAVERVRFAISEIAVLLLLAWTIQLGMSSAAFWRIWRGVETQRQYFDYLAAAGVPGKRVLVPMAAHPVNAFDATYYTNRTDDPAGTHDSETVMAGLGIDASRHFNAAAYHEELERNRPFLVINRDLSPVHTRVVAQYLRDHGAEYEKRTAFGREMWFRKTGR